MYHLLRFKEFLPKTRGSFLLYRHHLSCTVRLKLLHTFLQLQTTLAISTTAFIIVLRTWSAYQSLINKYIMNWSKTLYFKTIANNHALLTLLADRSEDELYKTAILICCFLRSRGISFVVFKISQTATNNTII